jgi:hypothetical protein
MKLACYNLIRHFNAAKECPETRLESIRAMFGDFGVLLAAFELCVDFGLLTDSAALRIALQTEKIEEGIRKWRNATRPLRSQERQEVADAMSEEPAVSNE